jgi:hypothetical protein
VTTPSDPNQPDYQSGLPNYPSAPSSGDMGYQQQQQPTYAPPREVTISFWCYVGAAAIVLIGGLFALGLKQSILDSLRNNNTTGLTESQLQAAANLGVGVALVISVIIAGLYLLFAFKLKAGRNWARIVLTVIAAIDLLSLVSIARQGGSPVSYIGALAAVVGCVLSYLPNSSAYFTAVKASRQLR